MLPIHWIGGFALGTIIYVSSAASQPLTLDCQAIRVEGMAAEWRQVDRIEIDKARSEITFAITRTLGSDDEKAWTFTDTQGDQIAIEAVDDSLRIVALRLATPVAIWVELTSVRLVALNKFGLEVADFVCRKHRNPSK
jgi:hypothetical protein